MTPKRVYVDLDGVLVDLIGQMHLELAESTQEFEDPIDLIDHSETIFRNAQPIAGAIDAIRELEKHYDVYILSTAPWNNVHAWTQKRLWVDQYLPSMHKKLILTHHKNLVKGDYLIDDRLKNGAAEFEGEHIHIFESKFPTWESVLQYLIPH